MQNFDAKQLRDIDISETIIKLGFEVDKNDKNQYKDDGFRISIKQQKWYDHENSRGGGGSIDLAKHVLKCDYMAAIEFLSNRYIVPQSDKVKKADTKAASIIPKEYAKNWHKSREYLINNRGLNPLLIDWCADHQLIYADRFNNCVFRYGSGVEMRGIYKKWRSSRGEKTRPFLVLHCNGKPKGLAVTESAIDALSYRQLFPNCFVASISGNGNKVLLQSVVDIATRYNVPLFSAFDNDDGGQIADKTLQEYANLACVEVIQHRPVDKDWNDTLLSFPQ